MHFFQLQDQKEQNVFLLKTTIFFKSEINMKIFLPTLAAISAASGYALSEFAQKKYPSEGSKFKPGDSYPLSNGKKKIFIGYTGHHQETIRHINPNIPLYYASKQTAQGYAGRYGNQGVVGHVVGNKIPSYGDHGKPRTATNLFPFGTYAPLSPNGIKNLDIEVVDPESVTSKTKVGRLPALKRMFGFGGRETN